jgi:hypothetical protein
VVAAAASPEAVLLQVADSPIRVAADSPVAVEAAASRAEAAANDHK